MRMQVEAQTEAAHVLANKIPAHMIGLFVEPDLLEGEDPSLYWNMVSAMIDEHRPETWLDWIPLNDLARNLWEERVFRRATNAIIRGGQRIAVQQFLNEIRPGEKVSNKPNDKADHRANKYFSENKKEREEIRSQLAQYGITQAELLARSAQNNSDAILMFEGMVSSRERSRRKLQKEITKRRPSQEVKLKANGDLNAGRQGPCQEVNAEANENLHAHHHGHPRSSQDLKGASNGGVDVQQASQLGSYQEAKAEVKQDGILHDLRQPGSCQEAKAKTVGEPDLHPLPHHGH